MQTQLGAVQRNTQQFVIPMARVTGGGQSVPTGTSTVVEFTTEEFDTSALWDPLLPNQFTIPIAGVYHMAATVTYLGSGGTRGTYFNTTKGSSGLTLTGGISGMLVNICDVVKLDVGDTVGIQCDQTSGVALTLFATAMTIAWLGVG